MDGVAVKRWPAENVQRLNMTKLFGSLIFAIFPKCSIQTMSQEISDGCGNQMASTMLHIPTKDAATMPGKLNHCCFLHYHKYNELIIHAWSY